MEEKGHLQGEAWGLVGVGAGDYTVKHACLLSMERTENMSVKRSEIGSVKAIHETAMAHAWDLSS